MSKFIVTVALALIANSALAWGPREQAALAGIVGGYVLHQAVNQPSITVQPAPVYVPQPVYVPRYYSPPRPTYNMVQPRIIQPGQCWQEPVFNVHGQHAGYQEVCR